MDLTLKSKTYGVKLRMPCFSECISENIIKFIIHNKLNDLTVRWNCSSGDLFSDKEQKLECKAFTSDGPTSFSPTPKWDVLYFLDARQWMKDVFILYRVPLKPTALEWTSIKVNCKETFADHIKQKRRPRITWDALKSQISAHCFKVYEGSFDDIFNNESIKLPEEIL